MPPGKSQLLKNTQCHGQIRTRSRIPKRPRGGVSGLESAHEAACGEKTPSGNSSGGLWTAELTEGVLCSSSYVC